jgi:hypothetical protein
MTTKKAAKAKPVAGAKATAPKQKVVVSKPSSNPFVSDHANHLDRGRGYGSSGSRRSK